MEGKAMDDLLGFGFERNQYFTGKLLTAQDFKVEQKYFNDKRRLLNRLLFGSGIICGLDVTPTGGKMITIEPGMALDPAGREIVVDELQNYNLSSIGGFPEGEFNGYIYLFIEYDEKNKDQVFSVDNSQQAAVYNRVQESYRLSIRKTPPPRVNSGLTALAEETSLVYEDGQIRLWHRIPRYVNPSGLIEAAFILEKLAPIPRFDFSYQISAVNLESHGGDNPWVSFTETLDGGLSQYEWKYRLKAGSTCEDGRIMIGERNLTLNIGDRPVKIAKETEVPVKVIAIPVPEQIQQDYSSRPLDKWLEDNSINSIYLAKITLIQVASAVGTTYHIDRVEKNLFGQHIFNLPLLSLLDQYHPLQSGDGPAPAKPVPPEPSAPPVVIPVVSQLPPSPPPPGPKMATGTVDFVWTAKTKGYYTEEIAHGLGPGLVSISTGMEELQDIITGKVDPEDERIYTGGAEVFQDTPFAATASNFTTGVIIYPRKGTFRIGIRMLGKTKVDTIRIRWWAWMNPPEESADTPPRDTKVVVRILEECPITKTGGQYTFSARVTGTNDTGVIWSVKDPGHGSISPDGVYSAPVVKGIYPVTATSKADPSKSATVMVVVEG